jgi:hypothetical protein
MSPLELRSSPGSKRRDERKGDKGSYIDCIGGTGGPESEVADFGICHSYLAALCGEFFICLGISKHPAKAA